MVDRRSISSSPPVPAREARLELLLYYTIVSVGGVRFVALSIGEFTTRYQDELVGHTSEQGVASPIKASDQKLTSGGPTRVSVSR